MKEGNASSANLQFHSTSVVIGTVSQYVVTSYSDRGLKQGEEGNAGRAHLQFHSTSVVIVTVSTVATSCYDQVLKQGKDGNVEILFIDVAA